MLRRRASAVARVVPASAAIGLFLASTGTLQAYAGSMLGYGTTLCGLALLLLALLRPHREPVDRHDGVTDATIEAGIENSLEDLKDGVWELRESEARYRDLLDTQANVIARQDGTGRLSYVNKAFCRVFGCEPEAVLGRAWRPVVLENEAATLVEGAPHRRYTQLLETASGPRWLAFEEHRVPGQAAATGETGAGGYEVQIVGTDVTEQRAFQAELAAARDQAQAADRAKSRFLAAMSHEIRTPMNGILGMASLLEESELSAEQRTYLEAIDQSARTLRLLIDEILDFSKIEAGKLVLGKVPFALDQCVQATVELLAPSAHEKGLDIAWTVDPRLPSLVGGDEARVRQILLNLIGNAVKFTDHGGVLVGVECQSATDGKVGVAISVKDTGIGLSREAMGSLFAEFGQAESEISQRRGGTGLGLVISRRLAIAMGGDVGVESEAGEGSQFTARLTFDACTGAGNAMPEPMVLPRAGSVLLAFDRPIERAALATSLEVAGMKVIECDAAQAIAEIEAAAATGQPVAHVVYDAGADPRAAAAILARAHDAAPAYGVRGFLLIDTLSRPNLEQFRAAGFGAYLVRPVRPSALLARFGLTPIMSTVSGVATALPGGMTSDQLVPVTGRHVLMAEDNAINALLATRMLANAGCTVVHVTDGEDAVTAISRSLEPGAQRFELVLMDVHMPRLDGISAAAAIRAMADARGAAADVPPMVALTANAFAEDRERCLAGGLDDYLAKPFQKSELLALLARWERRGTGDRPSAAA